MFTFIHNEKIGRGKTHFSERLQGCPHLHIVLARRVANDKRKIAMQRAFQRGFERLDEIMRQILQKTDRIDEQKFHALDRELTGGRVERSEQFVFYVRFRARKEIEEGGFPCIRITDQSHGLDLVFFAPRRLERSAFFRFL